nr:MAG TPA: Protein of unknown function (DUF1642) [Caudoviricetes sp.]
MLKDALLKVKVLDGTELDKRLTRSTIKFENDLTVTLPNSLIHFEEKVVIPKFVADWIEECKNDDFHLFGAMEGISSNQKKLDYWFREDDNMELFARAWLDGYEVEEEKRYYVRFKGMESGDFNYLNFIKFQHAWVLSSIKLDKKFRTEHTKKQLEEAGFGWVFDCEGIEIEEVTE